MTCAGSSDRTSTPTSSVRSAAPTQPSSAVLKRGFIAGVRAACVSVVDIGLSTTPILYFATAHWKLDGGANITGSHNPIEYNGVKMVHPGAAPLSEHEIQTLRAIAERGDYESGAGE